MNNADKWTQLRITLFVYYRGFSFCKVESGPLAKRIHVDHEKQKKMSHKYKELQMKKQTVY